MYRTRLIKGLAVALAVSLVFVAVAFAAPLGDAVGGLYRLSTSADGTITLTPYTPEATATATFSATPSVPPSVEPSVSASASASASATPTLPPSPTPPPAPSGDPLAAIRAAKAGQTVFVPAGTYTGTITVPDGVSVVGAGRDVTWLKGQMHFGSNCRIVGLKIGDLGLAAVHNRHSGATNTVFEDCRFRGGGGSAWNYVVLLGEEGPASHITFRRCQVERNLGTENRSMTMGYNNVTIWVGPSSPVSDILFEDCHIGVSNGVASGAPRMALECYTDDDATTGWNRITIRGCTFEVSDGHGIDFSDDSDCRSTGLVVENTWVKGAGLKTTAPWAASIDLEYPLGSVIRNNRFGLGREFCVQMTTRGEPYSPSYTVFTNNVIDLTPNGVQKASYWAPYTVSSDSPWGPTNSIVGQ